MTDTISTSARIAITPLAGAIGAELTGADTGGPLSDDAVAQIRQALLDHKVVFLRDQHLRLRHARWRSPSGSAR